MAVLGVDGWRGQWVGALLDGRSVRLLALADVAAVLAMPDADVIAIDMPIGLSEDGVRACDVEARRRLGRAGSSVFPAPRRQVLGCPDYPTACEVSRRASGKAGGNRLSFSGRIGRRVLRPGRYRARATATDLAGNVGAARRLTFRVVR